MRGNMHQLFAERQKRKIYNCLLLSHSDRNPG